MKKIANFIIPLFFEIDFGLLPDINPDELEKEKQDIKNIGNKTEKILNIFISKFS